MNIEQVNKQKWKVNKDLRIAYTDVSNIPIEEQELILSKRRTEPSINVCCSEQVYLTELSKSNLFTLNAILVSRHPLNAGYILEVGGKLSVKALQIRKKLRDYTPEQLEKLRATAKANLTRG